MRIGALLLTCEHGGNRVPHEFAFLFASAAARRALADHRGSDIGALPLARLLARELGVELIYATVTRLLIELNRSPGHPALFSTFSRRLDGDVRGELLAHYYTPYREHVLTAVESRCAAGGLLCHVSVHTFTPVLDGRRRNADVGLLYDPSRSYESAICAAWKRALASLAPELRVRRNYPYLGKADGLTTALRRRFAADRYAGIELETNQALTVEPRARRNVAAAIAASLRCVAQTEF